MIFFHLILFKTFFALRSSFANDWTGFKGCGLYQIKGVVKIINNVPTIILNEKTQSEITLKVTIPNEYKLGPYIDSGITATVEIRKSFNGSTNSATVISIKEIPVSTYVTDTNSLNFINSIPCNSK